MAALLVSELATNAVRHAGTPIDVGITEVEHGVTIAVIDSDSRTLIRRPASDNGGRRLAIMDANTLTWGVRQTPSGKAVFFDLPI